MIRERSFDGLDLADELGAGTHSFVECSFRSAFLDEVEWCGSTFERCDLTEVRFLRTDLSQTQWRQCTGNRPAFRSCDLTEALFADCDLGGAVFASVVAADASWRNCKLLNATFADVQGFGWEMASCVLMYADLRGVTFRKKTLHELDLTESDLRDADFREAVFERTKLVRADLRGCDFHGADLRGAELGPLDDRLLALKGATISIRQARAVANSLGITVADDPDE